MPQKNNKNNLSKQTRQSKQSRGYGNYSGYSVKNSGMNMAGAGVLNAPGRVRDAGRYGDRLRENKKYPNTRRRIITGKELTTPLVRKKIAEKAAEEKIHIKIKTIAVEKKKFPVNVVFCVLITSFFLICLICSQIVLNEKNVKINDLNDVIASETKREKILVNDLDNKNDLNYIIEYAVTKLEMVNEDLLQKHYINGSLDDKVEVMAEQANTIIDLPNIMSAIFKN